MAERRMFSKTIIDSDVFLDMPLSTQALYFHLAMRADDDGFVNNPKKIMRMIGAAQNEMEILLAKRYLLSFDSGIVVIKHWRIHNYIQKDRYNETKYLEEKATLSLQENKAYTECIQIGDTGKVRLDKVSIGKKRENNFKKPTIQEISEYCTERKNGIDGEAFFHYYESKNWMVGKNKMKSWKSAVITWEKRNSTYENKKELTDEEKSLQDLGII